MRGGGGWCGVGVGPGESAVSLLRFKRVAEMGSTAGGWVERAQREEWNGFDWRRRELGTLQLSCARRCQVRGSVPRGGRHVSWCAAMVHA